MGIQIQYGGSMDDCYMRVQVFIKTYALNNYLYPVEFK